MRRTPTALALTSLALILASCGGTTLPQVPQAGQHLITMHLSALGGLSAQGLTGDAPARTFTVKVRNSSNELVAFNGTTFDPTGGGSTTLVLNSGNLFSETLLLPAGTYTFENAVKDDLTGSTLLAYGPAGENSAVVSGDNAVVHLKFHGVFDPGSSKLDFSTNVAHLFTDSTFNLALSLKTGPVNGTSATVPTTDIGAVTYSLGNSTDGVLNDAGSKIGLNVTARGTAADSTLNVTASFSAWVRNVGTDTATYGPTSVSFAKSIETNALVTDTTAPSVTFAAVSGAYQNVAADLTGTATDDMQLSEIRVFDNMKLVASNLSGDGVTNITTDVNGNWATTWTPTALGNHDLTVVVADSSGNESRANQTVTVAATPPITVNTVQGVGNLVAGGPQTFFDPAYDISGQAGTGSFTPTKAGVITVTIVHTPPGAAPVIEFRKADGTYTYPYFFSGNGQSYQINLIDTAPLVYSVVDAARSPSATQYTISIQQPQ